MQRIPPPYRSILTRTRKKILAKFPKVKALIVIGSVAEGDYQADSDVDVVIVSPGRIRFREIMNLQEDIPKRVQLVPFNQTALKGHFRNNTTMAHAIQRGIVIYEKDHYLSPFLKKSLRLPDRKWMKYWFIHWLRFYYMSKSDREFAEELHTKYCQDKCICHVSDTLARVVVNWTILYLETKSVVPTTKGQIWQHAQKLIPSEVCCHGIKSALKVSHENRMMNFAEMLACEQAAHWLKDRLISELNVTAAEIQEMEEFYARLRA